MQLEMARGARAMRPAREMATAMAALAMLAMRSGLAGSARAAVSSEREALGHVEVLAQVRAVGLQPVLPVCCSAVGQQLQAQVQVQVQWAPASRHSSNSSCSCSRRTLRRRRSTSLSSPPFRRTSCRSWRRPWTSSWLHPRRLGGLPGQPSTGMPSGRRCCWRRGAPSRSICAACSRSRRMASSAMPSWQMLALAPVLAPVLGQLCLLPVLAPLRRRQLAVHHQLQVA